MTQIQNVEDGSVYEDSCDVFISAQGALNNWKWPNIPGLHDFKGKLLHSANWDESYDYRVGASFLPMSCCQLTPPRGKRWPSSATARVGSRLSPRCSQMLPISTIMPVAGRGCLRRSLERRLTNEAALDWITVSVPQSSLLSQCMLTWCSLIYGGRD
ncbi:hypothetical protein VTN96DRAFT_9733 [Rasamsonia emersonii]